MALSLNRLKGYQIRATDGVIGRIDQFFWDDEKWVVRYLVVNTGNWLVRHDVLISPISIKQINEGDREIHLNLTCEQVEKSPDIDTHQPVSRRKEVEFYEYYRWPHYWGAPGLWHLGPYGTTFGLDYPESVQLPPPPSPNDDSRENIHLRSTREVQGYSVKAKVEDPKHPENSVFGQVDDFLVDETTFAIKHLVVDSQKFWPSKSVLIATEWISDVDWLEGVVKTPLKKQTIKDSPPYEPEKPVGLEFEKKLYAYFGQPPVHHDDKSHQFEL